ncbi:MAG: threonine/serine ThrE exporter family protein [Propionibacteriaceae bacterium]
MTFAMESVSRDEELAAMSDAVCRMGSLMLAAGTGSFRVKAAMGRVAGALGIEQLEARVGLTDIVATTRAKGSFRTQVVEVPVPVVNTNRIGELMRVSLRAEPGLSVEELHDQLDEVEDRQALYPAWVAVVGALVACAAFAFLNHGRWADCVAAGFGAAAGKSAQVFLRKHFRFNQLADVGIAAAVAGMVYLLFVYLLRIGVGQTVHEVAFTSAILFLVPGFPLMTAALDLARFDFASGIARLFQAVMLILAASLGAWIVVWGFDLTPSELAPLVLPWGLMLVLRILASLAGVIGFALTFNTPWQVALAAGVIGAIANVLRLFGRDGGMHPLLSAAAATLIVGILAGWVGQRILAPRVSLSVPAVLIMIPGMSIYRALVGLINQDWTSFLANGMNAVSVVVALAVGLVAARMFTDPAWTSNHPTWTQMPNTYAQRKLLEQQHADEL